MFVSCIKSHASSTVCHDLSIKSLYTVFCLCFIETLAFLPQQSSVTKSDSLTTFELLVFSLCCSGVFHVKSWLEWLERACESTSALDLAIDSVSFCIKMPVTQFGSGSMFICLIIVGGAGVLCTF